MTWKERILAVLDGKAPDRIPWFPRMQLWYGAHKKMETLPDRYRNASLEDVYRDLGVGIHWAADVFKETYQNVTIRKEKNKSGEVITYETPYGELRYTYRASEEMIKKGLGPYLVEHPVKSEKDFDAVLFLLDHVAIEEDYKVFEADAHRIGEDGIVLAHMGPSPCQRFLRELMGFEKGFLELYDRPPKLNDVIEKLEDICRQIVRIIAGSPAEIVKLRDNLTAVLQSPQIFREHYLPFYQETSDIFHAHGKKLVVHGDGEMKPLLSILKESGIDAVEQFTPHPMTQCTMEEALKVTSGYYYLWGGIPSILFCDPVSDKEFDDFLDHFFDILNPEYRFILSVGDNVMPEAHLSRVQKVTQRVLNA